MGKVLLVFCVFWGFLCWFLGGGCFHVLLLGFLVLLLLVCWFGFSFSLYFTVMSFSETSNTNG